MADDDDDSRSGRGDADSDPHAANDDSGPGRAEAGANEGAPERVEDDAQRSARLAQELLERELMAAWVAGDRRAGDQLVRAYILPITRYFQRKINDRVVVEDLAAETFAALTRSARQVQTTVKAFIYGIAHHCLCRHFRKKKQGREDLMDMMLADFEAAGSAFVANQRVEVRVLFSAMRRISLKQALVLEMYCIEGIEAPEVAKIMGIPQGTVRGCIRLGIENLQREILRVTQDDQVLQRTVTTFTWLRGLVAQVEALRAQHAGSKKSATG